MMGVVLGHLRTHMASDRAHRLRINAILEQAGDAVVTKVARSPSGWPVALSSAAQLEDRIS